MQQPVFHHRLTHLDTFGQDKYALELPLRNPPV
jgi:hypothetical protein